jgi:hypothetical protein
MACSNFLLPAHSCFACLFVCLRSVVLSFMQSNVLLDAQATTPCRVGHSSAFLGHGRTFFLPTMIVYPQGRCCSQVSRTLICHDQFRACTRSFLASGVTPVCPSFTFDWYLEHSLACIWEAAHTSRGHSSLQVTAYQRSCGKKVALTHVKLEARDRIVRGKPWH